ncbi:hypothetical protein E4T47_07648 [Aureobasidium subglaciale]|nr:hypothetical protein E4T47_07648 [Aureobasidium subglaciale]
MLSAVSYDTVSLYSLRTQATHPQSIHFAERLNLWQPTAQRNQRGKTQPFPFDAYIYGIGHITTTSEHINQIFDSQSDMSWDAPVGAAWGASPDAVESCTHEVNAVDTAALPDTTTNAGKDPASNQAGDTAVSPIGDTATHAGADAYVQNEESPLTKMRTSLADLTNGDINVMTAHLAQGLGPHSFLERFASSNAVTSAEIAQPKRKPGPHHRLQALAEDVPLPESPAPTLAKSTASTSGSFTSKSPASVTKLPESPVRVGKSPESHTGIATSQCSVDHAYSESDDGPETPVAMTTLDLEPSILKDSPSAHIATVEDDTESDTASTIIKVEPDADTSPKPKLLKTISDQERKDLDPKASAWVPEVPEATEVNYLPPSCPDSPVTVEAALPAAEVEISASCREAELINDCCPVPEGWSVATVVGEFAEGDLFDGLLEGGVHKKVLCHYSHYFATMLSSESDSNTVEIAHITNDPAFTVFRYWIFCRSICAKDEEGAPHFDYGIDLKTLVKLWRFGAHIQAPSFTNTITDAIMAKNITANELFTAAAEIDSVLMLVDAENKFRLLISHAVILSEIQFDFESYDRWPKSLVCSILASLSMGRYNQGGTQSYSKDHPCLYHLHPPGRTCKS